MNSKIKCNLHRREYLQNGKCDLCNAYYERRKAEAKENKICHNHRTPLIGGRCNKCISNYKNRRDKAIAEGRCPKHFHTFLDKGECERCLKFRKDRRESAKINNTCHRHQIPLHDGVCERCKQIDNDRIVVREQLKKENKCLQHPIETKPCQICKEIKLKRKTHALEQGVCFSHPQEPAVTGLYCFVCWCKSLARDALGSKKEWKKIRDFYLNDGYCSFTNVKLHPGSHDTGASIDHIQPMSRGGLKTLANLQWVTNLVNRSKNDLTNKEYCDWLLKIYRTGELTPGNYITRPGSKDVCYKTHCKNKPQIVNACERHWFENLSSKALGTVKYAKTLKQMLENQNYKCIYSNVNLILGGTSWETSASLDHIIPLANGGKKSIDNVQFVTRRVNIIKQNLNHEEFMDFIKKVVEDRDLV